MSFPGLQALEKMEYPGRFIMIGRDLSGENDVLVYGITGRSPSSQARELVREGGETIRTRVTDPEQLKEGNEKLLLYNCIRRCHHGFALGNGAQTDLIVETMQRLEERGIRATPGQILAKTFAHPHPVAGKNEGEFIDLTSYEPDEPAFTPRISGCIVRGAALSIIRRAEDGSATKRCFDVLPVPGKGKFISTYAGNDVHPLPSFPGQPIDVQLGSRTADELAEAVYSSMASDDPQRDFRVGVAVVYAHVRTSQMTISLINRHDREG
jgi:IMP cyclohydrolase